MLLITLYVYIGDFMEAFFSILILLCTFVILHVLFIFIAYLFSLSKNIRAHKFGIGFLSEFFPNYVSSHARCSDFKDCVKCPYHNCPFSKLNKALFDKICDEYNSLQNFYNSLE